MPSISDRLREVREGLGFSQQVLAERCGVTARSQRNYEAGERFPDAAYLSAIAAAGADIRYILTGQREGPAPERLSEDERALLADYREASGPVRRAARAALQSGSNAAPVKKSKPKVQIGVVHGHQIDLKGDGITIAGHTVYTGPPPPDTVTKTT